MAERGIAPEAIRAVTYGNALAAYGLNGEMCEEHWTNPAPIDQRTLFQGNSVLRGGQTPVIQDPDDRGSCASADKRPIRRPIYKSAWCAVSSLRHTPATAFSSAGRCWRT